MPHAITMTTAELEALAHNPDPEIRVFAAEVMAEVQASREPRRLADPRITALAFAEVPPFGIAPIWRGQTYTLIGAEPRIGKDGEPSQVLVWRSRCWDCGEPFGFSLALSGSRWLNRRCDAHKQPGRSVQMKRAA